MLKEFDLSILFLCTYIATCSPISHTNLTVYWHYECSITKLNIHACSLNRQNSEWICVCKKNIKAHKIVCLPVMTCVDTSRRSQRSWWSVGFHQFSLISGWLWKHLWYLLKWKDLSSLVSCCNTIWGDLATNSARLRFGWRGGDASIYLWGGEEII